jgi:hypothetical protein
MSVQAQSTSPSVARTPTFHSDDVESLGEYRTLSVLAVVSLVIGLASPLCFAAPLARTIPLVGMAIALVALRQIAVSGGTLAGRWAAMTGLALSTASLLAVLSYGQVMRYLYVQQADEFGRNWLATLQSGDTRRAFRLTSAGAQPEPPASDLGPPKTKNPYDEFLDNPLIQRLTQVGAGGQIQLEDTYSYDTVGFGHCWVGQRFVAQPGAGKSKPAELPPESLRVDLRLQHSRLPGEGAPRWLVMSYEDTRTVAKSSANSDNAPTN